jgi:hypothetical protein
MTRSLWCLVNVFVIVVFAVATFAVSDSDFGFLWICSVEQPPTKASFRSLSVVL